jgi:hypothetical protein
LPCGTVGAQSRFIVAGRDIPDVEILRDGTKETLYRGFCFAKLRLASRSQYADVQFPDGQKVLAGELIRPVVVSELIEPRASERGQIAMQIRDRPVSGDQLRNQRAGYLIP